MGEFVTDFEGTVGWPNLQVIHKNNLNFQRKSMKTQISQNKQRHVLPLVAIAGAAAVMAPSANAIIISQTDLNQEILAGNMLSDIGGITGLGIDFTDTTYSPTFGGGPMPTGAYKSHLTSSTGEVTEVLTAGTVIGPGTVFFGDNILLTSAEQVKSPGLIGFNFEQGLGQQFGWIDISAIAGTPDLDTSDAVFDGTNSRLFLNAWGYETEVGKSIQAGATDVDEPATLALLALGAAGLAAIRRRHSKKIVNA
jgi:hypothetical protein